MKYFKIMNREEIHNGFKYTDGLNIDTIPFDGDKTHSCVEGGLYFSDEQNICNFLYYGPWIREVEIPEGEKVIADASEYKYRCHSLFLKERRDLSDVKTWEYLVECNVNIYDDETLRWAITNEYLEIVKFLIENDVDIYTNSDETLVWTVERGHFELVKLLIEKGVDIHTNGKALRWVLSWASDKGHLETVKLLMEKGANISAYNDEALIRASYGGHLEIVKFLVENGANIKVNNGEALIIAVYSNNLELVKFLVENGADIHARDNEALKVAVYGKYFEIVEFLKGEDSNETYDN